MYSYGDPEIPAAQDARFADRSAAERMAVEASNDDHVWAVWDDETGEVLALVFGGTLFLP